MPNLSGPAATTAIRKLGYKGTILGFTGHALPTDIADFTSAGADGVLIKPISREEMELSLNHFCLSRTQTMDSTY